jgi:hypothetical protein
MSRLGTKGKMDNPTPNFLPPTVFLDPRYVYHALTSKLNNKYIYIHTEKVPPIDLNRETTPLMPPGKIGSALVAFEANIAKSDATSKTFIGNLAKSPHHHNVSRRRITQTKLLPSTTTIPIITSADTTAPRGEEEEKSLLCQPSDSQPDAAATATASAATDPSKLLSPLLIPEDESPSCHRNNSPISNPKKPSLRIVACQTPLMTGTTATNTHAIATTYMVPQQPEIPATTKIEPSFSIHKSYGRNHDKKPIPILKKKPATDDGYCVRNTDVSEKKKINKTMKNSNTKEDSSSPKRRISADRLQLQPTKTTPAGLPRSKSMGNLVHRLSQSPEDDKNEDHSRKSTTSSISKDRFMSQSPVVEKPFETTPTQVLPKPGVSVVQRCQLWGSVVRGNQITKTTNRPGKLTPVDLHHQVEIQKSPTAPVPKRTHLRNKSWGYSDAAKENSLPVRSNTTKQLPITATSPSEKSGDTPSSKKPVEGVDPCPSISEKASDTDDASKTKSIEPIPSGKSMPSDKEKKIANVPAHETDKLKPSLVKSDVLPSPSNTSPCSSSGLTMKTSWRKQKQGLIAKSFSSNDAELLSKKSKRYPNGQGTKHRGQKHNDDEVLISGTADVATEELREAMKIIRSFNMDMINQFVQKKQLDD